MKNITNHCNLLMDQLRNLHDTELQAQHAIEMNVARANSLKLKKVFEYYPKQSHEHASKFEKRKLYIKNMLTNHCKIMVKEELERLGLHYVFIDLGEVEIMEDISAAQREQLKIALLNSGFELMGDTKAVLVEKIKNTIVEMVYNTEESIKVNFSDFLSKKLNHDYTYMANLFSEALGTSIQLFIMAIKIERVKELMTYGELSISEIAWKMNYSSIAHLSNQFKKITGMSPSHFKQLKGKNRIPIEEIGNPNNIHQLQLTFSRAS